MGKNQQSKVFNNFGELAQIFAGNTNTATDKKGEESTPTQHIKDQTTVNTISTLTEVDTTSSIKEKKSNTYPFAGKTLDDLITNNTISVEDAAYYNGNILGINELCADLLPYARIEHFKKHLTPESIDFLVYENEIIPETIKLAPQPGYKLYTIDSSVLPGFSRLHYVLIPDGVSLPDYLMSILHSTNTYQIYKSYISRSEKNHHPLEEISTVQNFIQQEKEKLNPDQYPLNLGNIDDKKLQKDSYKKSPEYKAFSYYDRQEWFFDRNGCLDNAKVVTSNYQRDEHTIAEKEKLLEDMTSDHNRALLQGLIDHNKKALPFRKAQEELLQKITENRVWGDEYFSKATKEHPIVLDVSPTSLQILETYFENQIVGYKSDGYYDVSNNGYKIGKIQKTSYNPNIDFAKSLQVLSTEISLPIQNECFDKICSEVKKHFGEVVTFKNIIDVRNEYATQDIVIHPFYHQIPTISYQSGYGNCNKQFIYSGLQELPVPNQEIYQQVLDFIQQVEQTQKIENERNFEKKFLETSKDGGVSATFLSSPTEKLEEAVVDRLRNHSGGSLKYKLFEFKTDYYSSIKYNVYINTEKIIPGKPLSINIPSNIKGHFIGKGGTNIKAIANQLGVSFIKLLDS